ncbi:phage tail protein [Martelella mediterranea]|uniref:Phage tail protein n=1 Tax=Martelella mediterranea TaxID=293089 RepID=A0A4R3NUJ2_9HYPH|nr:phage tail protein [Martelella mediterranea]TCT41138.1 hypothetical protein EDC90_1007115 [Martelella mediterranea]
MGMPLLGLGPHTFEVTSLNFQSIRRRTETELAEIARFGGRAGTQFTGHKRGTITISGLLFPEEFDDRAEYEKLRASQMAGRPLSFTGWAVGTGTAAEVFGLVMIKAIEDTQTYIGPDGKGRRIQYAIELAPSHEAGGKPVGLFGM